MLAEYFGSRLVFNPEAMKWLEELLRNRNLPMNENNKSQAFLPDNCRILRNLKVQLRGCGLKGNGNR
ncbi:MAG: hypothetical protein V8S95_02800 [Odoribacter sp.]